MAIEPSVSREDPDGSGALGARASEAALRDGDRLAATAADLFVPERDRLEDRLRLAVIARLEGMVSDIEIRLRSAAGQAQVEPEAYPALVQSGLLRDAELVGELVDGTRLDLLAEAMPTGERDEADRPNLLVRLTDCPDAGVAKAAKALLLAAGRRAGGDDGLPAELQHRLVWWIAAVLDKGAVNRALTEAASALLREYDEGERAEALALRLAVAIDARPEELSDILVHALDDRHPLLFVALLAHAGGLPFEEVRRVVLDAEGHRLWLLLRAQDVARAAIARIGVALADGDPRRDLEPLADAIDTIAALPVAAARQTFSALRLPTAYHQARRALAGNRR